MLALGLRPCAKINNSLVQHNRSFQFTGVLTITRLLTLNKPTSTEYSGMFESLSGHAKETVVEQA